MTKGPDARPSVPEVLPADWHVGRALDTLAADRRLVVFAGLPGVGKSLLLKELVRSARRWGRRVFLLQWDVTRGAFETDAVMARYPETDGFTHPVVKRAVGTWARRAVLAWHQAHPGPEAMLIAEAALVGNRLIELAERRPDEAEALLSGDSARFIVPVPSREVRLVIETARDRTMAEPQHAREAGDAPPNVLRALWRDTWREGHAAGVVPAPPPDGELAYDPDVYRAVFLHWLRHRRVETLDIDRIVSSSDSVYDLGTVEGELAATPEEVEAVMHEIEAEAGMDRRP